MTRPASDVSDDEIRTVELREIGDQSLLREVYERLYLPSVLAAEEREALSTFEERLGPNPPGPPEPSLTAIVAGVDLDDPARRRLAGYLILERYRESRTALLAYVGVAPEFRRRGLMRRIYEAALRRDARRGESLRAAFAEIHVPGRIDPRREPMETLGRVRALAALGARLVPIPYVQPPLEPGQSFGRDLMLIALPTHGDGQSSSALASSAVRDFLDEYFRSCDLAEPSDYLEYRGMIAALDDPSAGEAYAQEILAACQGTLTAATLERV